MLQMLQIHCISTILLIVSEEFVFKIRSRRSVQEFIKTTCLFYFATINLCLQRFEIED